jgi:hypothetical protein
LLDRGKQSDSRKIKIIGPIRNEFMAKRFEYAIVLEQKSTGHALNIACRQSRKIAFEPGHQHAIDTLAVEILAQFGTRESESVVEFAVRIGKARQIVQFVGRKEFYGAVFAAEVHKSQARALGLQFGTKFRELGDRLAAKRSAKVP